MIHPDTELRFVSPEIGLGVFAREAIPKGTALWVLCRLDIILDPRDAAALPAPYQPILDRYAYTDWEGRLILCWDNGRYVNHSCDPAMVGVGNDFEIAVRDIAAGEELTCDYATLYPTTRMACVCGSPRCRGHVDVNDLAMLAPVFDRQVASAIHLARHLPQPLLPFARDEQLVRDLLDGRVAAPAHRRERLF